MLFRKLLLSFALVFLLASAVPGVPAAVDELKAKIQQMQQRI